MHSTLNNASVSPSLTQHACKNLVILNQAESFYISKHDIKNYKCYITLLGNLFIWLISLQLVAPTYN
jgi:hypothetical protein